MSKQINTPWGCSQDQHVKADGIVFHSTASHGGHLLSAERQERLLSFFPWFGTFAGGRWYEEDCDAAAVVIAFRDEYTTEELRRSVQIADSMASGSAKWAMVKVWLDTTGEGSKVRHAIECWEKNHAAEWEPRSMGSPPKGYARGDWYVSLRRVGDGARKEVVLREYPSKHVYTDAELEALIAEGWGSV